MPAATPLPGEVYRVRIGEKETLAVVVSCSEANALRRSVVVSEIYDDSQGIFRGQRLPTVVPLPSEKSGLAGEMIVYASLYTIPQARLIERRAILPPHLVEELNTAIKRVLGFEAWPT